MGARILVVDDNRTNLDLMLYLLRAFGHQPVGAADGLSGVDAARKDEYDLILCDILMPGIDGFELARTLRSDPQYRNVRLVAVTALAMVGDRDRILAAGFDGYIAKPIEPETFVLFVDQFLPDELQSKAHRQPQSSVGPTGAEVQDGPLILAVDDIQVNLDVIGGALRPFGFRIAEARNGNDAYELAKREKPLLILCDVHMRGGDGFEFIEKVKADTELSSVPFLFITSTAWRTADHARGIKLGARKFIQRPIDPALLLEEVQQLLQDGGRGDDTGR